MPSSLAWRLISARPPGHDLPASQRFPAPISSPYGLRVVRILVVIRPATSDCSEPPVEDAPHAANPTGANQLYERLGFVEDHREGNMTLCL